MGDFIVKPEAHWQYCTVEQNDMGHMAAVAEVRDAERPFVL